MQTIFWTVKENTGDCLREAASVIKRGGLVAFPTETVYGLGADGLSPDAVAKIFAVKGRPADNPLILHIGDTKDLAALTGKIPPAAQRLINAFWPGPLTLVLEKSPLVPAITCAGLSTVAVRMPSDNTAAELIRLCGVPLAAPSANISGCPSPTDASAVAHDLSGKIDGILDGGPAPVGLESTVVDCTGALPVILRPGGITKEAIEEITPLGAVCKGEAAPRAPGMKYRHYAPEAPLFLLPAGYCLKKTVGMIKEKCRQGLSVGVLASAEVLAAMPDTLVKRGGWQGEDGYLFLAAGLYAWLREFDRLKVDLIIVEPVENKGIGVAINNRLDKAAGGRLLYSNML